MRAIYRRALARGDIAVNPTTGLELPAVRGRRDRIAVARGGRASARRAPGARPRVWATAMYAGLRRGELQALRWDDVDLAARRHPRRAGVGRARGRDRAEDPRRAPQRADRRALRDYLDRAQAAKRASEGLVFGRAPTGAVRPDDGRPAREDGVDGGRAEPITLHEAGTPSLA